MSEQTLKSPIKKLSINRSKSEDKLKNEDNNSKPNVKIQDNIIEINSFDIDKLDFGEIKEFSIGNEDKKTKSYFIPIIYDNSKLNVPFTKLFSYGIKSDKD